jgi:mannose-1-phosphate guanylyltransferase
MYQHTIDRARSVVSDEHIVSIIGRGHRKFLSECSNGNAPGIVIEQPNNLGTAPGVFLPTAYVLSANPEATIIFLPSDHFVHPEELFSRHMERSFDLAEKHCEHIILTAAVPDCAETEYGWIDPNRVWIDGSNSDNCGPMKVARFREKPDEKEARVLLRQGCLWNTMVMTVKAKTLWMIGRRCLPEMMHKLDAFLMVLRAMREERLDSKFEASALAGVYSDMASADFSRDILQHVSERIMALRMNGVTWCDWGRPERVTETLAILGRRPFFTADCLENAQDSSTLETNAVSKET